jgi:Spy/CpxP family protein refolding chaperone
MQPTSTTGINNLQELLMSRTRNLALVAVLGAALTAGAAYAQDPAQDGPRRGGGPGVGRQGTGVGRGGGLPLRELNLSEAQQQQIRALREQYQAQVAPLQERLRADIQNVLTPEQQATAQKLNAERDARRAQVRERLLRRLQQRQQPTQQ